MATCQFLLLSLTVSFFSHLVSASVLENHCVEDLQRIKLKIAHLETKIDDIIRSIDEKGIYIEDQDKLTHQMSQKIKILQSSVLDLKTDSLSANEKHKALEQEVQLLWATLRRNNFDIHVLKSKAQEAEAKLETVSSQAEKVSNIVTENWIQLQRLEQALHMNQMMTLRVRGRVDYSRCSFFRFISKLSGDWLQQVRKILDPYIVHFKRCYTQTKDYHHQLQLFIKRELETNEYTSALANEELVFFVASALITFPILGAWMFLLSQLH